MRSVQTIPGIPVVADVAQVAAVNVAVMNLSRYDGGLRFLLSIGVLGAALRMACWPVAGWSCSCLGATYANAGH